MLKPNAPRRKHLYVLLCLVGLTLPISALAQDIRFGASGSLAGVASLDATWLFTEVPAATGGVRFGVRTDASAQLSALTSPSIAASLVLDATAKNGSAAHIATGIVMLRATGAATDFVPSAILLAGVEWPLTDFLRLRLEGSVVPAANAAGIGFGIVVLPFGVTR